MLPVYALKAVKAERTDAEHLDKAVLRALGKFDLDSYSDGMALGITLDDNLNYPYLRRVAESIASVLSTADESVRTLFLVIDKDVAKTLGSILKEELAVSQEIIALDGIDLGDLDYIDIGRPMGKTEVLPVTVKSLIFPTRVDS